jgi:DNA polymerase alpha subunit A
MSKATKKSETNTKKDKEMLKKADSLMENLFNQLDEDDLMEEMQERPKINEYMNSNSSMNVTAKSFLYSNNNYENSKSGNTNNKKANSFINVYELNPTIAPKISQNLETSKLANNSKNTSNNFEALRIKHIYDNDLDDYGINMKQEEYENMDIEEVEANKKTEVQDLILKNNKNILCGRQKVQQQIPIQSLENEKRKRTDMESALKKTENNSILAGRTVIYNIAQNKSKNDSTDQTNTILTPIKQINFKDSTQNSNKDSLLNKESLLNSNSNFNSNNHLHMSNSSISSNPNISLRNLNLNKLPINPDNSLFIYWIDMIEEIINRNHCVIIFGKVYEPEQQRFSSISLVLKNIERILYIIPKDDKINGGKYDLKSVTNEFHELRKNKFAAIDKVKTKEAKKKYCFELPIEHGEHECLEIRYNSNLGQIPANLNAKTFDYIFGRNNSLLEIVLVEKNIRGPSWIKIEKDCFIDKNGNNHITWSKYEIDIENYPKAISVFDINNFNNSNSASAEINNNSNKLYLNNPNFTYLKSPAPLNILSISTKTITINDQPEIYSICGTYIDKYLLEDEKGENERQNIVPIIVVRKVDHPHIKFEDLEKMKNKPEFKGSLFIVAQNETAVINQFINKIGQYDPDIIVGHKLYTEHLDFLINRINKLKISNWSKIGRLKRDPLPKFIATNNSKETNILRISTLGRLICDTMISCKDMLKESNFDLDYLSQKVLELPLFVLDPNKVFSRDLDPNESTSILDSKNPNFNNSNNNIEKHEIRNFNKIELVKDLIFGIFKESIHTYFLLNKFSILSLTKELTCIGGNLWIKSLQNSRADRCEMLLMHEFHKNDFILPDKLMKFEKDELEENDDANFLTIKGNKRKPQYSGGLVLEPKADLYDTIILLLDFNSLYPSIIQEFNICFSTVMRKPSQQFTYRDIGSNGNNFTAKKAQVHKGKTNNKNKNKETRAENNEVEIESEVNNNNNITENGNAKKDEADEDDVASKINDIENDEIDINNFNLDLIKKTTDNPILPGILASLVARRKKIKEQIKTEKDFLKKELLEIKQKAVKLSANSLYGYLGYKNSRFYAKAIAALITSIGRNILKKTVDLVRSKFSLEVIYGDTDSIMINTLLYDLSQAMEIGKKIKNAVNEKYRLLEMEVDGVFKTLLLLKKKKYASLKYEAPFGPESKLVKEYKGLDLVRRDWCELSKQVGIYILDIILSGKTKDEMTTQILDFLKDVGDRLGKEPGKDADAYNLSVFEITKQITKNIEDYGDSKNLPHVRVAKRLREKGDLSIKMNTYIPYIVCVERPAAEIPSIEGEKLEGTIKPSLIGNSKGLADKCFHFRELIENPTLKIDVEWYKSNQIIASVGRLCKHISQINMHQLANCIGLDSNKYNSYLSEKNKNNEIEEYNQMLSYNNKNKGFLKIQSKKGFEIKCLSCNDIRKVDKIFSNCENIVDMYKCSKCFNTDKRTSQAYNKIILQAKRNMMNYYKGVKTCLKCKTGTRLFLRYKLIFFRNLYKILIKFQMLYNFLL